MKYLKSKKDWNIYLDNLNINYDNIHILCDKYDIKNYTINENGEVNCIDEVNLILNNLKEIPINFSEVKYFDCSFNNLVNLKGAPKECNAFYCVETSITTLEYAPEIVNKYFNCSNNHNLKSLKGAPKECNGFYCRDNPLIKTFDGLENTNCEYYYFEGSPINRLYSLFKDPKRINEFIDIEITDGHSVKIYRLEHFLNRKLTSSEVSSIEMDYYLL